jgi:hypothetical protein
LFKQNTNVFEHKAVIYNLILVFKKLLRLTYLTECQVRCDEITYRKISTLRYIHLFNTKLQTTLHMRVCKAIGPKRLIKHTFTYFIEVT